MIYRVSWYVHPSVHVCLFVWLSLPRSFSLSMTLVKIPFIKSSYEWRQNVQNFHNYFADGKIHIANVIDNKIYRTFTSLRWPFSLKFTLDLGFRLFKTFKRHIKNLFLLQIKVHVNPLQCFLFLFSYTWNLQKPYMYMNVLASLFWSQPISSSDPIWYCWLCAHTKWM